jgi:hypothetical protein
MKFEQFSVHNWINNRISVIIYDIFVAVFRFNFLEDAFTRLENIRHRWVNFPIVKH